jgi:hypothetical protein
LNLSDLDHSRLQRFLHIAKPQTDSSIIGHSPLA